MNILPKKSWHVRTKQNIERVRRDEAEAERRLKIEQERKLVVEHELRIRELKARAGHSKEGGIEAGQNKHINLFEDCSFNKKAAIEAAEERKKEEEWQERAGIVKRLVGPRDKDAPWYTRGGRIEAAFKQAKTTSTDNMNLSSKDSNSSRKTLPSDKTLSIYDPMIRARRVEESQLFRPRSPAVRKLNESTREKPLELHDYAYYRDTRPPICTEYASKIRKKAADEVSKSSGSSPEIIKVVEAKHKRHKDKRHQSHKRHRHSIDSKSRSKRN